MAGSLSRPARTAVSLLRLLAHMQQGPGTPRSVRSWVVADQELIFTAGEAAPLRHTLRGRALRGRALQQGLWGTAAVTSNRCLRLWACGDLQAGEVLHSQTGCHIEQPHRAEGRRGGEPTTGLRPATHLVPLPLHTRQSLFKGRPSTACKAFCMTGMCKCMPQHTLPPPLTPGCAVGVRGCSRCSRSPPL